MIRREDIKDFLSFSGKERRGIGLLILVLLTLCVINWMGVLNDKPTYADHSEFRAQITRFLEYNDSLNQLNESVSYYPEKKRFDQTDSKKSEPSLFYFDPNTLNVDGWIKLGLSQKQANGIINYRNAGGVFRKPEDLKKMYTVSEEMYELWKPFIQIQQIETDYSEAETTDKFDKEEKIDKTVLLVNINTADTLQLMKIRGVGSYYANKIVNFREALGGYVSIEQIKDIYGMREENYEKIKDFLNVNDSEISRINLNKAGYEELKSHPYLSYKQASTIVNYRDQHGNYNSVDDLYNLHLMDSVVIEKIRPYLSLND